MLLEVRTYTVKDGKRDEFVDWFENYGLARDAALRDESARAVHIYWGPQHVRVAARVR